MIDTPRSRVPLVALVLTLVFTGLWVLVLVNADNFGGAPLMAAGVLVAGQFVAGLVAFFSGLRSRKQQPWNLVAAIVGLLSSLGALAAAAFGVFIELFAAASLGGGAWGRPLRVRGRQLHPELREGADWTRGARPNPAGLDEPTRAALEALWLHDAQKEHASVPAFSRISWLLAAVGAPADLMAWSHRAALEEIDHTQRCFALAAGYAGRSHTVEPMPDLLLGGLDVKGDALAVLAHESLTDGCQLEDFNADVAAECAAVCREPVTRAVLEQIAREERSHAEFSWALVDWLVAHRPESAVAALEKAVATLERYPRPTAVSDDKRLIVDRANASLLRDHGRLPDERWADLWTLRLAHTKARLARSLDHTTTQRAA